MLEKSYGLMFFLKQPKNVEGGNNRYIYLRITVDGIPKEYSIKRQWHADRWVPKAGRASGTKEDAKALNAHLDSMVNAAHAARNYLLEKNLAITSEAIKTVLLGETDEQKGFSMFVYDFKFDDLSLIVYNHLATEQTPL
jgi:hypothetical protein